MKKLKKEETAVAVSPRNGGQKPATEIFKEAKKVSLIVSRCLEDPDKFRLVNKPSFLGEQTYMCPAAKIINGGEKTEAVFKATEKCHIYGEVKFLGRIDHKDEQGIIDAWIYEAVEVYGSSQRSIEKTVSFSFDEIEWHSHVTPLTKQVFEWFREFSNQNLKIKRILITAYQSEKNPNLYFFQRRYSDNQKKWVLTFLSRRINDGECKKMPEKISVDRDVDGDLLFEPILFERIGWVKSSDQNASLEANIYFAKVDKQVIPGEDICVCSLEEVLENKEVAPLTKKIARLLLQREVRI